MKRISIILFSVFYLLIAAGINVNAHWCGKNINFISIDAPHEKKCPCGDKMPRSCCKDVHFYVKVTDSQKISSPSATPNNPLVKAIHSFCFLPGQIFFSQSDAFDFTDYHAPPFKTKLSVYLLNRIFRI